MPAKIHKKISLAEKPVRKRGRPRKVKDAETAKKAEAPAVEKTLPAEPAVALEPAKKESYFYAVGRRKSAVAKIRAYSNLPVFNVNRRPFTKYFTPRDLQKTVLAPLALLGLEKQVGFEIFVSGGGTRAQAAAIRHGIARALILRNPEDKPTLKKAGMLTRDPRVKERKKPGLKRARRGPQWAKR